ncbi:Monooxygenase, FAD-binding [Penicillium italicum]|uniref:Monooxygenase, FAD-binding n=1 Tax=Penicillium italicum TaxID=40296 RepID=A0A0A2LPT7_PENIT|nr:Monooxygenase, FAD-binding [Penicillium italicum]
MASSNQDTNQFKVLIAGGSLVGLALALAFERAGIEYELFEKGEFATQLGASIGIHPHTIRILEQLGVWKDIERQVVPLQNRNHYDGNGHCFEESHVLAHINQILRRPIVFMERCKALEALYSHVKDKSKLHARTAVVEYEETAQGITVTTEDGEQHHGHILIGADGIHSKVRKLMADKISVTNQARAKEINEAFKSEYNCIFAVSRNDSENQFLPDAMVHNTYYDNYSTVAAAGVHGLVFWFLFVKASKLTRTPNCPRFTDEDAEATIQKYGSALVGPGYTVKDLWDARVKGTMVPLEEGVVNQWSHNRVVLMGDAVHKSTVNPGLGGNLAYEGIARLTNGLVPLLKQNPMPSLEQLTEVFNQYTTGQKARAETVVDLSGQITRYEAQETRALKFAARYVVPWVSDRLKAKLYASFSRAGPFLEYLPLPVKDVHLVKPAKKPSRGFSPKVITAMVMGGTAAVFLEMHVQTRCLSTFSAFMSQWK